MKRNLLSLMLLSFSAVMLAQNESEPLVAYNLTGTDVASQEQTGAINGYEYVDLGVSVLWATYNIGAEKVADNGEYFAWGEITPKTEDTKENSIGNEVSVICGNADYDAVTATWGTPWRLPTEAEVKEICDVCQWEWMTEEGNKGYKVIGPNGNSIFLPAAGYNIDCVRYDGVGENGNYWYCTAINNNDDVVNCLYIDSEGTACQSCPISYGLSIRPVASRTEQSAQY